MTLNELNQIRKDGEALDSIIAEPVRLRGVESSGVMKVLCSKPDDWKSVTNEVRALLIHLIVQK